MERPGSMMMGRRKFKLWLSQNVDGMCDVGVMVKEELCEVVEIKRVSDGAMVVFAEDVLRLICGYTLQSGRHLEERHLLLISER